MCGDVCNSANRHRMPAQYREQYSPPPPRSPQAQNTRRPAPQNNSSGGQSNVPNVRYQCDTCRKCRLYGTKTRKCLTYHPSKRAQFLEDLQNNLPLSNDESGLPQPTYHNQRRDRSTSSTRAPRDARTDDERNMVQQTISLPEHTSSLRQTVRRHQ